MEDIGSSAIDVHQHPVQLDLIILVGAGDPRGQLGHWQADLGSGDQEVSAAVHVGFADNVGPYRGWFRGGGIECNVEGVRMR